MQSLKTNQTKAILNALIAVFLWSTVASVFKLTLSYVSVVELVLFSSLTSTIVLGLFVMSTKRWELVQNATRKDWFHSLFLGLMNPFLYYLILFKAYDYLLAQEALAINYTWALTLSVLAVFLLKQKMKITDFLGLILGYIGILFIATRGNVLGFNFSHPLGVILAFASTIVWAFYWIYSTKDKRDPVVCLFQSFLLSLPFIFAFYVFTTDFRLTCFKGLMGSVYIGLFEMSVTFVFWLKALKLSNNAARVSMLIFLSPCLSLYFIHVFVGEPLQRSTFVGLALILIGLFVQKMQTFQKCMFLFRQK